MILFRFRNGSADRVRHRGCWRQEDLQYAVNAVLVYGMSKKKAAKVHKVSCATLQRHIRNAMSGRGVEKKLRRRCILTDFQEEDLSKGDFM